MRKIILAMLALYSPLYVYASNNLSLNDNDRVMIKSIFEYDTLSHINNGNGIFDVDIISVTADKIYNDYDANEARGDKSYKGKMIAISGTVEKIRSTLGDVPSVTLSAGGSFSGVSLYFAKEFESLAIDLNKGDSIRYVCNGDGSIMGDPVLRECTPVDEFSKEYSAMMYKQTLDLFKDKNNSSDVIEGVVLFAKVVERVTDDYKLCRPSDSKCIVDLVNNTPKEQKKKITQEVSASLGLNK
ncbi:TPA: OB-fold protein [Citrobacter amalonaticus]